MFSVTVSDWQIAKTLLQNPQYNQFLPHTVREEQMRPKYESLFAIYKTRYSFIKIGTDPDSFIYALARGNYPVGVVGKGTYGKVKYVQDELGHMSVMKVMNMPRRSFTDGSVVKLGWQKEAEILKDLGYSNGITIRPDKNRAYIQMRYCGVTLLDKLKTHTMTHDERLTIAINLCKLVASLHNGELSKRGISYYHGDIKPANVACAEDGTISLLDFGLGSSDPMSIVKSSINTPLYSPHWRSMAQGRTGQQLDILALLRTLFLPPTLYCGNGFCNLNEKIRYDNSLLPSEWLIQNHLMRYISTESSKSDCNDFSQSHITARDLTSILMSARLRPTHLPLTIQYTPQMQFILTQLYSQWNSTELIQSILVNQQCVFKMSELQEKHLAHIVTALGCLHLVKDLIERDPMQLSHLNDQGQSLLSVACIHGNLDIVKYLLELDHQQLDQKDLDYETPLSKAVFFGHIDVVNHLITSGASLTERITAQNVPLLSIIMSEQFIGNKLELLSILLKAMTRDWLSIEDSCYGDYSDHPFHIAVANNEITLVAKFLEYYSDLLNFTTRDGRNALFYAVEQNHVGMVRFLLDKGASISFMINKEGDCYHGKTLLDIVNMQFATADRDSEKSHKICTIIQLLKMQDSKQHLPALLKVSQSRFSFFGSTHSLGSSAAVLPVAGGVQICHKTY